LNFLVCFLDKLYDTVSAPTSIKQLKMKILTLNIAWLLAALNAAVTSNPLPQSGATVESDGHVSTNGWKSRRQIAGRFFCPLPAAFPPNVVSVGGVSGCVPRALMQGNRQCLVACKAGYVPEPGTVSATTPLGAQGSYMYAQNMHP
jgi:hypothetical protein